MPNVNKVLFGNTTVMDISDTTASPEDVAEGEIFYAADGARSVGTGSGGGAIIDDTTIAYDKTWSSNKISTEVAGAQNTIESITINGTTITPDANKDVAFSVLTNAVNDLQNYYLKTQTYTKTEVDNLIGAISTIHFEVVAELPTTDIQTNVIYLVPSSSSATDNIKDEYINLDGTTAGWEKIGTTEIDLSNYIQKSQTSGLIKNDGTIDTTAYAKAIDISLSSYNALSNADKKDTSKIYFISGAPSAEPVQDITWTYIYPFGNNIWTDGTNIYYSYDSTQWKFNGTGWAWNGNGWSGLTYFDGKHIWTDGNDIYYSYDEKQYKLNGTTWESVTWTGLTYLSGEYIWTDGNDIYYSYGLSQCKLNGTTWENVTWTGVTELNGLYIWTDNTNIYYSRNSTQLKLDDCTAWEQMTWSGTTDIDGQYIWKNGTDIYYFYGTSYYKLNGTTWESISISGDNIIYGLYVWTDGTNVYHSYSDRNQLKLNFGSPLYISYKDEKYQPIIDDTTTASDKIWSSQKVSTEIASSAYALPTANDTTLGGIKVGTNLSIDANGVLSVVVSYTLPPATDSVLGGVKIGSNITVTQDGAISTHAPYSLPTASANTLGGIKVGSGLSITDGVLSADGGGGSDNAETLIRDTVGWTGKNLGKFVNGKGINSTTGEIMDLSNGVATPTAISIESGKIYKAYAYDVLISYSVWNDNTLVRTSFNNPLECTINTAGGNKFYVGCVTMGGTLTVDDAKPMVLYSDVDSTVYEPYHDDVNAVLGDLSNLTTTSKSSLVAAINEINTKVGGVNTSLDNINGGNLMGTTAEKLEYLSDTKELIRQAIISKGVQVSASDSFRSYAEKIGQISGGGDCLRRFSAKGRYDNLSQIFASVDIEEVIINA